MYELNFKSWACIILTGLFLVVGGVGSCMYIRPKYNVWSQEMAGKAIYLKNSTRKLLQQYIQPGEYEAYLTHTVDMDGKPIFGKEFQKI